MAFIGKREHGHQRDAGASGTHTGILFGQIAAVAGVALGGVWAATQWTAHALAHQPRLGAAWFELAGAPVYEPWKLFEWWYWYDAYQCQASW